MEEIIQWLGALPLWLPITLGSVTLLVLALVLAELIIRRRFWKIIRSNQSKDGKKLKSASPFILRLHVRWLERLAKKKKIPIMDIFDFRQPWLSKFKSGRRRKDLFRLLDFYTDFALFPCFEVALKHKERGADFIKRLGSGDEAFFQLKRLGASCNGRDFDSSGAKILLKDHLDALRELSGDSDWAVRDFSIHVILNDQDPRSQRLIWESLQDSHGHIRSLCAKSFQPPKEDREKFYSKLLELYLHDPNNQVRRAAKTRIAQDFSDLYRLSPDTIKDEAVVHVLELLDRNSKEDENIAFGYLDSPDSQLRLASARFLQSSGALERLFMSVNLGDRETFNRTRERLEKASGVQVLGFLSSLSRSDNPGTLYLASILLQKAGERALIQTLVQKVFSITDSGRVSAERLELYSSALKALKIRGNFESAQVLKEELQKKRKDEVLRALIWENLPGSYESLFIPDLIQSLKEGQNTPAKAFHSAWKNMSPEAAFPPLMDLLENHQDASGTLKKEALFILGELKLPGLMQNLLESLHQIPREQIPEYCGYLAGMNEELFLDRVGNLIRGVDSQIRSAIFLGLPPNGKKAYLKEIREALSDADPDVRLCAFTALSEYDESKVLTTNAIKLLRDPVDKVRQGVAKALGSTDTESTVTELKSLIYSSDEVLSVREAAAMGLGASALGSSISGLIEEFPPSGLTEEIWSPIVVRALGIKTDKKQILDMIERFKDASLGVRKVIAQALSSMGAQGEQTLMDLLSEGISSMKPVICEAIEATGAVDIFIRKLGNRDPQIRKDAAGKLVLIGTSKAFKGIVEAARDPSAEVRVLVTKALESLNTPAGAGILKELENDPDKRVRRYTAWALERIKAKAL